MKEVYWVVPKMRPWFALPNCASRYLPKNAFPGCFPKRRSGKAFPNCTLPKCTSVFEFIHSQKCVAKNAFPKCFSKLPSRLSYVPNRRTRNPFLKGAPDLRSGLSPQKRSQSALLNFGPEIIFVWESASIRLKAISCQSHD